jgi:hypothetical protein
MLRGGGGGETKESWAVRLDVRSEHVCVQRCAKEGLGWGEEGRLGVLGMGGSVMVVARGQRRGGVGGVGRSGWVNWELVLDDERGLLCENVSKAWKQIWECDSG